MQHDETCLYAFTCRNCRYARTTGVNAKLSALTKATSHALRLGHTVNVSETDLTTLQSRIIETIDHERTDQEGIPF